MRKVVLLAGVIVALAATTRAQTVTYYLHKSASPVAIPGGTTVFTLDEVAPSAPGPVAETVSAPKGTTPTFPTFVAPTFAAPVTLGMDFDVVAYVSANLSMNNCAFFGATIDRVDAAGVRFPIARGTARASVPQGSFGGTVGFAAVTIPVGVGCDRPTDDVTFEAGESVAVTVTVTNACKANRSVSLAYDATSAQAFASFSPTLPPDEVFFRACFNKCQLGLSKAVAKFLIYKNKCVMKCQANARKGLVSVNDCYPPYAGTTAYCVADPLRGVEAKALASIQKACVQPGRCPPCYTGGDCTTHSVDVVQNFEGALDSFVPGIYCDPAITAPKQVKCLDNTAKALWKLYASRSKCYDTCYGNESKSRVAPNSCNPPATDPGTMICLDVARQKAAAAIDKLCAPADAQPSCGGEPYPTGSAWANLMAVAVDSFVPSTYCGE